MVSKDAGLMAQQVALTNSEPAAMVPADLRGGNSFERSGFGPAIPILEPAGCAQPIHKEVSRAMKQMWFFPGVVLTLVLGGCQSLSNRPKLFGGNANAKPASASGMARTTAPANPQPLANQNPPINGGFPAPTNSSGVTSTPGPMGNTPGSGGTNSNLGPTSGTGRFNPTNITPASFTPRDMNSLPSSPPPNPGGMPGSSELNFRSPPTSTGPSFNNGPVLNPPNLPANPVFNSTAPTAPAAGPPNSFNNPPPIPDPVLGPR
jgi:hypothetical protein